MTRVSIQALKNHPIKCCHVIIFNLRPNQKPQPPSSPSFYRRRQQPRHHLNKTKSHRAPQPSTSFHHSCAWATTKTTTYNHQPWQLPCKLSQRPFEVVSQPPLLCRSMIPQVPPSSSLQFTNPKREYYAHLHVSNSCNLRTCTSNQIRIHREQT